MSDPATNGIHLTKQYYKEDFGPSDFQWDVTKIDNDFTLLDLFKLVRLAETVTPRITKIFGMSNFDSFWDQINKDKDPNCKIESEYLELYWSPEHNSKEVIDLVWNDPDEENPNEYELPNLMSFHGIGPGCPSEKYHKCDENCPKDQGYGIEFTPVNNLAHLPIRVLPSVNFSPPFVKNGSDFHRTGFQLKIDPTLWCFITSIFWELTFVDSTPDKIANNAKQMSDTVIEAKKRLKEANGDIDALKDLS